MNVLSDENEGLSVSYNLLSSQKWLLAPNFSQSFLHFHVSQCVDQRVEHGSNNGVEKSKHFVFWKSGGWPNVNEEDRHEEQNHNCYVGTASGKSFTAALCWVSPDCVEYQQVRQHQHHKGHQPHHARVGNHKNSNSVHVSAGQFQQRVHIAEIVVYLIGATEG